MFWEVRQWLSEQLPREAQRALTVRYEGQLNSGATKVGFDGTRRHWVGLGGQLGAWVWIESGGEEAGWERVSKQSLHFECTSVEARDALLVRLAELGEARRQREAPHRYWLPGQYGWQDRPIDGRPLATVILKAGQLELLQADLTEFMESRDRYVGWGLPWHRCYLLHGPAGTGKSSIVRALATHFGCDIYHLPLGEASGDTSAMELVSRIGSEGPRAAENFLLLEDVDVFNAATSREAIEGASKKLTLSGLLNALDGVGTPQGLVTFITSNHIEKLDPSLIRPGRVDVQMELSLLDDDQLQRMVDHLYPASDLTVPTLDGRGLSPAAAIEAFKRNPKDPELMLQELFDALALPTT